MSEPNLRRRDFLATGTGLLMAEVGWNRRAEAENLEGTFRRERVVRIALVQFDAVPEQVEANLQKMSRLTKKAADAGAKWVVFHEGTVCDYTGHLDQLAETVPGGQSTRFMAKVAKETDVVISFGLSERDHDRFYITQVFVGPSGFFYRYRKTWLWREREDRGFRNEWARYDPGTGPELFEVDGIKATCMICADGNSSRCLARIKRLRADVVFYPNNRKSLNPVEEYAERAKFIGAPLLVSNRIGMSWTKACEGGCIVYGPDGTVVARANRQGREEVLIHDLRIPN
jgi:predicted amidohydrolase